MQILGKIEFNEILAQWGLHEGKGRIQVEPPERVHPVIKQKLLQDLNGPQSRESAIKLIRGVREPVISAIELAKPIECLRAEVIDADLDRIRVMYARPLVEHATDWYSRESQAGAWVKSLVGKDEQIGGPFLAVARTTDSPLTLLDGLHRAAAWVIQGQKGKQYPIAINIVLTRLPVSWEFPGKPY